MESPTIPIPFSSFLKVVLIADAENAQVRELVDRIAAEKFEIEVTQRRPRCCRKSPPRTARAMAVTRCGRSARRFKLFTFAVRE